MIVRTTPRLAGLILSLALPCGALGASTGCNGKVQPSPSPCTREAICDCGSDGGDGQGYAYCKDDGSYGACHCPPTPGTEIPITLPHDFPADDLVVDDARSVAYVIHSKSADCNSPPADGSGCIEAMNLATLEAVWSVPYATAKPILELSGDGSGLLIADGSTVARLDLQSHTIEAPILVPMLYQQEIAAIRGVPESPTRFVLEETASTQAPAALLVYDGPTLLTTTTFTELGFDGDAFCLSDAHTIYMVSIYEHRAVWKLDITNAGISVAESAMVDDVVGAGDVFSADGRLVLGNGIVFSTTPFLGFDGRLPDRDQQWKFGGALADEPAVHRGYIYVADLIPNGRRFNVEGFVSFDTRDLSIRGKELIDLSKFGFSERETLYTRMQRWGGTGLVILRRQRVDSPGPEQWLPTVALSWTSHLVSN